MKKHRVESVALADLKPHPRNYRNHPQDQLAHLAQSIREFGVYRNIVVARDLTILAGHGVAQAAKLAGVEQVPVVRLDMDPLEPLALKVVTADNEVGHLAEVDDRLLSELLKEVREGASLLGTGYDDAMLANLVFVTRPESEIADLNEAAEWVGMPDFGTAGEVPIKVVVAFQSEEDRDTFVKQAGLTIDKKAGKTWSTRWPYTPRLDVRNLRYEPKPEAGR